MVNRQRNNRKTSKRKRGRGGSIRNVFTYPFKGWKGKKKSLVNKLPDIRVGSKLKTTSAPTSMSRHTPTPAQVNAAANHASWKIREAIQKIPREVNAKILEKAKDMDYVSKTTTNISNIESGLERFRQGNPTIVAKIEKAVKEAVKAEVVELKILEKAKDMDYVSKTTTNISNIESGLERFRRENPTIVAEIEKAVKTEVEALKAEAPPAPAPEAEAEAPPAPAPEAPEPGGGGRKKRKSKRKSNKKLKKKSRRRNRRKR